MHDELAIARSKRMHRVERQIVHSRYTRHRLDGYHHRNRPVKLSHWLADAQEARWQPAVIGRQPRMVGGGVDRFIACGDINTDSVAQVVRELES